MKHVEPGALHVVTTTRIQDGAVGFFYARDPSGWLAAIAAHMQIGETDVRPAAAAAAVVEHLRSRFRFAHVPSDALPWYLIDYDQAIAELARIDLATGAIHRLSVDTPVMLLPERQRGRVSGYTRGGDIVVRLDSAIYAANLVIARRENVKPILRALPAR